MFSVLRVLRLLFILFLTTTFLVWFAWPSLLKYRDYPHPTIFTSKTVPFLANQTSSFLPTLTIGTQITSIDVDGLTLCHYLYTFMKKA